MLVSKPIRFTVAIDGPAAAGKGTVAKGLADHFGFSHLDTGLLYRAIAVKALVGEDPITAANELVASDMTSQTLQSPKVARMASKVAVIPQVRAALLAFQENFASQDGGAVLDGRDIGTIICPEAQIKIFITASAEIRAKRRYGELQSKGLETSYDEVLRDVKERDERDMTRKDAPLKPAHDAHILDTSRLSIMASLQKAIDITSTAFVKAMKI